ncbi:guanine nucleotide binding protein, alpha subunit [Gorgonomyces haynaldii]|nr:guanine nucleotide binding protein, alpha subunit [Gorgonomyces haynaldii]
MADTRDKKGSSNNIVKSVRQSRSGQLDEESEPRTRLVVNQSPIPKSASSRGIEDMASPKITRSASSQVKKSGSGIFSLALLGKSAEEAVEEPSPSQLKKQESTRSKQIDALLREEAKEKASADHISVLVLGPGDSGKSTFLKQLVLQHGGGFTKEYREEARQQIHQNLLMNLRILINKIVKEGVPWGSDKLEADSKRIQQLTEKDLDLSVIPLISGFLKSEAVKTTLSKGMEGSYQDTATYFYDQLDTVLDPEYLPTDEDILYTRRRTENITESKFHIAGLKWTVVDVAGQMQHRHRWIPYYETNPSAVIFVVSAPSYCQEMEECPGKNRISDAIELYEELVSTVTLNPKLYLVFLNKVDLLESRMSKYPVSDYIPAYMDAEDPKAYLEWLSNIFREKAKIGLRRCRIFKTQATDKHAMKKITMSIQ